MLVKKKSVSGLKIMMIGSISMEMIFFLLLAPAVVYVIWNGIDSIEKQEQEENKDYEIRKEMDYWE